MCLEALILCLMHNNLKYISHCYTIYSFLFQRTYKILLQIVIPDLIIKYEHHMCSCCDISYKHNSALVYEVIFCATTVYFDTRFFCENAVL